jgi:hypothetical protein
VTPTNAKELLLDVLAGLRPAGEVIITITTHGSHWQPPTGEVLVTIEVADSVDPTEGPPEFSRVWHGPLDVRGL